LPYVGAVHSLYRDAVQVSAAIEEKDYRAARNELQQGRAELSNRETEQALLLLSTARRAFLREHVDDTYRHARLTVFIRDANYRRIDGVLQTAAQVCANHAPRYGLIPFGDGWVSYLTVRLLVEGQLISIPLALLTDLVLISLFLKSIRIGLIAILPVAFSMLIIFATLATTNTALGIANSMFAGIAMGIGLDFSIHLTAAYQQKIKAGMLAREALARTLAITAPAICISATSITAGFAVLTLSEIAPNVQLGLTICLCLLTCAVTTLLLVPALVMLRKKVA
jgi:predicted RND superfamily exporter protein